MPKFHFHDAYELIVVLEGHGEMRIGAQRYAIEPGTVMCLGHGAIHRSEVNGAYRRYVFKCPPEYIAKCSTGQTDLRALFSMEHPSLLLDEEHKESILELCQKTMVQTTAYGNDLLRQHAFVELLIALNQLVEAVPYARVVPTRQTDRVAPILDYIATHARENITLDTMATHFFITKQHLCYLFKKATGMGIHQYIVAQRLLLACGYLRDGYTVERAGEQAGFGNNAHFIRTFQKTFGTSPGKYAASYQKSEFHRFA